MIILEMENYNKILTEELQEYNSYHPQKLIKMNI